MSATIKDVARMAGVSTATVSRSLTRPALVAEATRAQVLRAVAEAGYTPNLLARSLRRSEARAVLVLVRDIANPFYPEIFRGVERTAQALGFSVLMGNTDDDPERERAYAELVLSRRADGMIVLTGKVPTVDGPASRRTVPTVIVSDYTPGSLLPTVRVDHRAGAEAMVRHLIGLGHRRIAHIAGPANQQLSLDRVEGWRGALREAGLPASRALLAQGDFTLPSGVAAMERLLDGGGAPTAVFASNDEMAIGAIHAIRERGLAVPRDLSVAGFDDILFSAASDPPLTTIRQPRRAIGERAMLMLHALLEGRPLPQREVILPTELVVRRSAGPCPPG